MFTSRCIPESEWERARRLLVFYFAHRGVLNAEDLAQETLTEFWRREDYTFDRDEDFLRVCYAFASRILQASSRKERRRGTGEFDENQVAPKRGAGGLNSAESAVFLNEVIATGRSELGDGWKTIVESAMNGGAGTTAGGDPRESNRIRVQLHRARRKLVRLTGWDV
jgi:hypothetical protein